MNLRHQVPRRKQALWARLVRAAAGALVVRFASRFARGERRRHDRRRTDPRRERHAAMQPEPRTETFRRHARAAPRARSWGSLAIALAVATVAVRALAARR